MLSAEINGLEEVQDKMNQTSSDLTGNPMVTGMRKATLIVTKTAKSRGYVPVDRGHLRASITPVVVTKAREVQGIVGSNKIYAPYQELGTPKFTPPRGILWAWAMRKAKRRKEAARELFVIAFGAIKKRGIKPKKFLQRALEDNADKIFNLLGNVVTRIVEK